MGIQLFSLVDKMMKSYIPVYRYDTVVLPVGALRYAFIHQEKLGINLRFSWEELSNDRTGSLINDVLRDLAHQKPEISLGLRLFNSEVITSLLPEFIYQVGKINLPEDCHEILEAYFEASAKAKSKAGNVYESRSLNILGSKLMNIESGASIYDFACGYGRTLAEFMRSNSDIRAIGNDVNQEVVGISQLHFFMCGLENVEFQQADTLELLNKENPFTKKFDYVISHPPIGLKLEQEIHTKYGLIKKDAIMGFIIHALNSLKDHGKAVITVSNGILFQGASTGAIRRQLIEDDLIEAVLTLPAGLLTGTSIPVTMLVFNMKKDVEYRHKVLMIDASSMGEKKRGGTDISELDIKKIVECYNEWKDDNKFSRVLDVFQIGENNYNLLPSSYVQMEDAETIIGDVQIDRSRYEDSVATVPLKELVHIYRGLNTASSSETDVDRVKVIQLSDVNDGVLGLETVESYGIKTTTKGEEAEIQSGDVLLTSRGIAMKFTVVPDLQGNEPFYLSANFIGLRPLPGVDPHFILAFFESPIGESYIRSLRKGAALPILNVKDIQDIPIPKLSVEEMMQAGLKYKEANREYFESIATAEKKRVHDLEDVYSNIGLSKGYKKKAR